MSGLHHRRTQVLRFPNPPSCWAVQVHQECKFAETNPTGLKPSPEPPVPIPEPHSPATIKGRQLLIRPLLLITLSAIAFAPNSAAAPAQEGQLDGSETLFTVLAAINAAGYDADLDSPAKRRPPQTGA